VNVSLMYVRVLLCLICALPIAGCLYEHPFVEEDVLPIDANLVAVWEEVPPEVDDPGERGRLTAIRFSDTEYLIHYPSNEDGGYFRGYLVRLGEKTYIQIEAIAGSAGPLPPRNKRRFHLASYSVKNDQLQLRMVDPDQLPEQPKDSEALRKGFMDAEDHPDLFDEPGTFRRLGEAELGTYGNW